MKKLFSVMMVTVLMFAALVQGISAEELCITQSYTCPAAAEVRNQGMADLYVADALARERANEAYAARYTGLAADYFAASALARELSSEERAASYTKLAADYFAAQTAASK